ncbi:DUF2269 family protein [Guptibacillus hwajinpoensis]|uniref:DUF2269 family protein n=1 Tax=Guptibacillus hwajinpoensis TaxID=208199 RepID=UPI001F48E1A6|nr:DUF2269 family protein [Pseudalkalibacillus hwajinpoensis]
MSFYGGLLAVHIIAAVCGLGATFGLPVLMGLPKTVSQARFAHSVSTGIEKIAKIGSLTLLVTGLRLGALPPFLFTQSWLIALLVIYILVQPIVAGIVPKKTAQASASFRGSRWGHASGGVQTDWKTDGTFYKCNECICYYSHYFTDIETLLRIDHK